MSMPYVGEIRLFAGNFAPAGWMFCAGQMLAISQYDVLFNLIGTTYGGDGVTTFALPDLQGRVPVHSGSSSLGGSYVLGEKTGVESVTLSVTQIPSHTHAAKANGAQSDDPDPGNRVWGAWSDGKQYSDQAANVAMNAQTVGTTGGSQPHDNMIPFLGLSFIISLFGVFPSQT